MMIRLAIALVLCGVCTSSAIADTPDKVTPEQVRKSIAQAVPYLEREGENWITKRQCVSCHQVSFMVWGLNAAAQAGQVKNSEKLAQWNAWAADWRNFVRENQRADAEEAKTAGGNVDTIDQLILGGGIADATIVKRFRGHLLANQQENGRWKAGGQLPSQKRPKPETEEVSTLWTLLALAESGPLDDGVRKKGLASIDATKEAVSTEWWVARLLVAEATGNAAQAEKLERKLLSLQREDGGWGWLSADASDGFGTGLALYALAKRGRTLEDLAVRRGAGFLLTNQRDDGAWPVPGTKANAKDRVTPTATYWGSAWATIGLAEISPSGESE